MSYKVLTITKEHLNRAIKARKNKKPGVSICSICIIAQALTDKFKEPSECAGGTVILPVILPYPYEYQTKIESLFDWRQYDEIRKMLPARIRLTPKTI